MFTDIRRNNNQAKKTNTDSKSKHMSKCSLDNLMYIDGIKLYEKIENQLRPSANKQIQFNIA